MPEDIFASDIVQHLLELVGRSVIEERVAIAGAQDHQRFIGIPRLSFGIIRDDAWGFCRARLGDAYDPGAKARIGEGGTDCRFGNIGLWDSVVMRYPIKYPSGLSGGARRLRGCTSRFGRGDAGLGGCDNRLGLAGGLGIPTSANDDDAQR